MLRTERVRSPMIEVFWGLVLGLIVWAMALMKGGVR